jgi:hypothetical protein
VAKIVAPVLLVGKSMRTLSLRSFHAMVMSRRGEILAFLAEPLVGTEACSVRLGGSLPPLVGHLKQL